MSRQSPVFWHRIRLLLNFAPPRAYQQILRLIFLALLAFITILCPPVFSTQQVIVTSPVLTQNRDAHALLQQGIERYEVELFSEAIEIWQEVVSDFVIQGDQLNQALVLRYLSLAYQHLGQWEEARRAIAKSLQLLNNLKNVDTQIYLDVLAKALNTQGRLQWAKGRLEEAIETWKKAAATYQKTGNQIGVIGSTINQAEALQVLGLSSQAEAQLGQLEQQLYQLSDSELKATGLQNLGKVLRQIGNLRKSQEVLQTSLQVARKSQLLKAECSALLELGNTERALGNRAIAIGKQAEANQHNHNAIAFYQQAANVSYTKLQAQLNLLSLLEETGQHSDATKLQSTIQPLIANLPPSRTNIYAQLHFARSLTCLQTDIDKILPLCINHRQETQRETLSQQNLVIDLPSVQEIAQTIAIAIQQARSLKDKTAESYALGQLGELYELTQQLSIAQELTQQALLLAEEIQSPDIRYRWEWQLGRLWEKRGDPKNAIAAYQEAVKTLKSVRSDLLTINSDVQFSFRDNVEPLHRKLVDLLLRTDANTQPTQENLKRATDAIDSLRLAELENFLHCNLSQKVQLTLDIDRIDEKAAFVYPIILEDRLEIIFKLPGQPLKRYVTPVKGIEVEKIALELRSNILRRNRPEAVIEKATQVYNWLIEPLEQDLENSSQLKTLVFVLDGALRNIPMSVLYDSKRQEYLMQKPYAIALVPGLQLFDLESLKREQLTVLTAGVSEQREVNRRKFDELPNVAEELQRIGSIVPSKSLLNPEFTQANLQQQIQSGVFSTVHIATHGKFSSDPEETYILAYDRLLKSSTLAKMLKTNNQSSSSRIELLVLSACETAHGDNRATLGLAGIAVRAGARSVLSTLWQVSDRSTVELMEQFYKELTNPEVTKAQALHQAQQALFKQYKAPYYWAPYVLVGNWL